MTRRRLQILEPCTEDFAAMKGGPKTRFCDKCDKNVHNLSEMTEREADAFFRANARKSVCIRMTQNAAGEIRYRAPTARRAGFVAAIALAMAACTGHGDAQELESPESESICHDANGYAIRCADADEWFAPDAIEPGEAPEIARAEIDEDSDEAVEVETVDANPPTEESDASDLELLGDVWPTDAEQAEPVDPNEVTAVGGISLSDDISACPIGEETLLGRYDPAVYKRRLRERKRLERQDARAERRRDRRARRRFRNGNR